MFVGIGGNVGHLQEIIKICIKNKLKLILDAAHMAGTRWMDTKAHIGNKADATIFSFHAVKNLPTGDSGMLCLRDSQLDAKARKLSWLGINKDTYERSINKDTSQSVYKWHYDVKDVGFKLHGNSIMAAMALVSLKYLEQNNAYRRQICDWYDLHLREVAEIERVPMSGDCIPSRHLYQIKVNLRDEIMLDLNKANIFPGVHYRDNTLYKMYSYGQGTCPHSMGASNKIISLPLHLRLDYQQVEYVAKTLKQIILDKFHAKTQYR